MFSNKLLLDYVGADYADLWDLISRSFNNIRYTFQGYAFFYPWSSCLFSDIII